MTRTRTGVMAALWLFGSGPMQAAAEPALRRIAVVCLGDQSDSEAVASIQHALESQLAGTSQVTVMGAEEIAPLFAAPRPPRPKDDPDDLEDAALLDRVRDAYYAAQFANALSEVESLAALRERRSLNDGESKLELAIWRTAIYLAMKDQTRAESEASAALALFPDLKVDLHEYRPSVAQFVEAVRATRPRTVRLVLDGVPEGATVKVDDRHGWSQNSLAPGPHKVEITAPGRLSWSREGMLAADARWPVLMPLQPDPKLAAQLTDAVWRQDADAELEPELVSLAGLLHADWLLVVAIRQHPEYLAQALLASADSGVLLQRSGPMPALPGYELALSGWTEAQLRNPARPRPRPAQVFVEVELLGGVHHFFGAGWSAVGAPHPWVDPATSLRARHDFFDDGRTALAAVASFSTWGGRLGDDLGSFSAGARLTESAGGVFGYMQLGAGLVDPIHVLEFGPAVSSFKPGVTPSGEAALGAGYRRGRFSVLVEARRTVVSVTVVSTGTSGTAESFLDLGGEYLMGGASLQF